MSTCTIREVNETDIPMVLSLIKELAVYEKMEDQVIADEDALRQHLFEKQSCYCVLAFEENQAVGFALYFFNYSTFVGKRGLYLEDLYVKPDYRGKGYGKQLLMHLVKVAQQQNCGRMEWSVLNWNKPAIDFYENLGALPMNEWTVYRLRQEQFATLLADKKA